MMTGRENSVYSVGLCRNPVSPEVEPNQKQSRASCEPQRDSIFPGQTWHGDLEIPVMVMASMAPTTVLLEEHLQRV